MQPRNSSDFLSFKLVTIEVIYKEILASDTSKATHSNGMPTKIEVFQVTFFNAIETRRFYLTGDMTNHLFKVLCNYRLVNYFPLMYRYVINTNILHLTFTRPEYYCK